MPHALLNAVVRALAGAAAAKTAAPTVQLTNGTLHGDLCAANHDATSFFAIPYAKPPTGDLRFAPPQPYDQKYPNGVRNATQAAPSCIQFGAVGREGGASAEDCLFVNVWKPANASSKPSLPVRVYVTGEANLNGGISDPAYDGCTVAAQNAVMVTINYRLGPLGFLALDSAGLAGNQGLLDIMQGLAWVQQNIGAFGGDPKKVLLHGHGAGAADAFTIATLPQAPTLMSAFISESGGGRDIHTPPMAASLAKTYAAGLKCATNDAKCLRSKSVDDLTKAYSALSGANAKQLKSVAMYSPAEAHFAPYLDGKVVPHQPAEQPVRVPAVFGSNAFEGTFFAMQQFASQPKGIEAATEHDYTTFLTENFGDQAAEVAQRYPLAAFQTTKAPAFYAIAQIITDADYLCPASRALNTAASHGTPVWTYHFSTTPHCTWANNVPQGQVASLGASYGAQVPFVLGATTHLPLPAGSCQMSSAEEKIAAFMRGAWTEMAATKQPVKDAANWPAYGGAAQSRGINLADGSLPGQVNYTACDFWAHINSIQVAEATNGTNVTVAEQPHLTTQTTTVTGVHTIVTEEVTSGKTHTVTTTVSGPHAITTTFQVHPLTSTQSHSARVTTITHTKDLVHTETVKDNNGKLKTETKTSPQAVATTVTVDDASTAPSITYAAPNNAPSAPPAPANPGASNSANGANNGPSPVSDGAPAPPAATSSPASSSSSSSGAPQPSQGGPQNQVAANTAPALAGSWMATLGVAVAVAYGAASLS